MPTQARSAALAAMLLAGGMCVAAADAPPRMNLCASAAGPVALGTAQWNGWGRDPDNTRYQPEPAIRASDVPRLVLKWAFGIEGSAVSGQPTVVDGRLFVTSAAGRVYSLDSRTGCTYWTFDASAGARTAISVGELASPKKIAWPKRSRHKRTPAHVDVQKAPSAAFFGDDSGAVYALDAQKGTLLWKTQVETHPLARILGAPTLYHGRLYIVVSSSEPAAAAVSSYGCCTFRGSVAALDIGTGQVLWKTYLIPEEARPYQKNGAGVQEFGPAGVAVSASPTVDGKRGVLYVGTGGSYTRLEQPTADAVMALDLTDGKVRWVKQLITAQGAGPAGFDSSPILRTLASGKQIILAGQKSGIVYGLDPDRGGEVLWQTQVGDSGGIEWGPAADHRSVYVALAGLAAEPPTQPGSLTALNLKTGARRWQTQVPAPACAWGELACSHAQSQAVTVMPGAVFSGSMDGHLRAYSTIDGKIVWDFDTAKQFATVNGVKASGGSLDQGGATIVNGIVYINSGYGQRAGQSGNVLLAFSVESK